MEFKTWVDDNLNEVDWKNWFGGVGDKFKAAGRMLGINRQPQQQQQAPPTERKTVGFKANDLHNIKAAMTDYNGLVARFLSQVSQELKQFGPEARQFAVQSFEQNVKPYITRMRSWVKWINDQVANLPVRESVILEGIKVNYKNFENMAASIRDLTKATGRWLQVMGQHTGQHFMRWARDNFQNTIGAGQAAADQQFNWLNDKIKQLMAANNMQYQGLENSPYKRGQDAPGVARRPMSPEELQRAYNAQPLTNPGPQMYRGMASQGQDTRAARDQGLGVSMLSRGQQGSVPLSRVGKPSFRNWMGNR